MDIDEIEEMYCVVGYKNLQWGFIIFGKIIKVFSLFISKSAMNDKKNVMVKFGNHTQLI